MDTQEIESWEMADEHPYRADDGPSIPDSETTDEEGSGEGNGGEGDYKDLRQRLAVAKRLRPSSVQELAMFAKADKKSREIRTFALALEIKDLLSFIEGNWSPSGDALVNIKEFSTLYLLSVTSPTYKFGSTAVVLKTLKKVSVGLPEGWYDDAAKRGTVATAVTKYMTETRSSMKKLIRTSIEGPKGKPDETQNIAELASAIVGLGGPLLRATVQHWGRFAVMRSVFGKTDGSSTFWDKVDKELSSIRENANVKYPNDRNKAGREVHTSINTILEADYDLYGNPSRYGQHPVFFESESGTELATYARARAQADKENSRRRADGQAHKKKRRTK